MCGGAKQQSWHAFSCGAQSATVPSAVEVLALVAWRVWLWVVRVDCDGVFVCGLCAQPQHSEPMGCGFQNHVLVQLPESLPAY